MTAPLQTWPFAAIRSLLTLLPFGPFASIPGRQPQDVKKGQGTVEFALAFPIVIVMIVALMELGFLFYDYVNVVRTTREAARAGAVYLYEAGCTNNDSNRENGTGCTSPYTDNIQSVVNRGLSVLGGAYSVSVTYVQAETPLSSRQGDLVSIAVSYQHRLLTSLFGQTVIPLSGRATAKIE